MALSRASARRSRDVASAYLLNGAEPGRCALRQAQDKAPGFAALALDLGPHWQPSKPTLKVGRDLVGKVCKVWTTDQAF